MKPEPTTTLNVRNFPVDLRQRCKAKAALVGETLEKFVVGVLRAATKEIEDKKPK